MIQITLNDVTYSVTESSNGTDRTLIDILKDKIMSCLLEDEEFYGKMKFINHTIKCNYFHAQKLELRSLGISSIQKKFHANE